MEVDFEIVEKEKSIIPTQTYVTFKCLQDCKSSYFTFFDTTEYKAHQGDYIRVKMHKNKAPVIGRRVGIEYLIEEAIQQNKFK